MKPFYRLLISALLLSAVKSELIEASEPTYHCNSPFWNAPAESRDGLFTGDLSLECSIESEMPSNFEIFTLRRKIIEKLQAESIVHHSPASNTPMATPILVWDVSHAFEEDGNSIKIRELVEVSILSTDQLKYQTHSKEIIASGMAGYLRSIEFSMLVVRKPNQMDIRFNNRVQVKRPWFALDLLFAPIAKKICLNKMDQVKQKFMPWFISILREY